MDEDGFFGGVGMDSLHSGWNDEIAATLHPNVLNLCNKSRSISPNFTGIAQLKVQFALRSPSASRLTSRSDFVTADANWAFSSRIEFCVSMMRQKTGAIFLRCTDEEAERIRHAANEERRSVSGFILNAVFGRIQMREKLRSEQNNRVEAPKSPLLNGPR